MRSNNEIRGENQVSVTVPLNKILLTSADVVAGILVVGSVTATEDIV